MNRIFYLEFSGDTIFRLFVSLFFHSFFSLLRLFDFILVWTKTYRLAILIVRIWYSCNDLLFLYLPLYFRWMGIFILGFFRPHNENHLQCPKIQHICMNADTECRCVKRNKTKYNSQIHERRKIMKKHFISLIRFGYTQNACGFTMSSFFSLCCAFIIDTHIYKHTHTHTRIHARIYTCKQMFLRNTCCGGKK